MNLGPLVKTLALAALLPSCASRGYSPQVTRVSVHDVDGVARHDLLFLHQGEQLHARYSGEIELAPDESEVVALEEGASLSISQLTGTSRRRVVYSRARGGEVLVDPFVGGRRVVSDAAHGAWRAGVLADLVARVDLGGAARGARLLEQGGAQALLDHLEFETNGSFSASYLPLVLADPSLEDAALPAVVRRAARVSSSSSVLAAFLVDASSRAPADPELTRAIVDATRRITSGSARSEALGEVLALRSLEPDEMQALIAAAGEIPTASGAAFVLAAVADSRQPLSSWRTAWLREVSRLPVSARQLELCLQLLAHPECDATSRIELAQVGRGLASTTAQSEVLGRLIRDGAHESTVFDVALDWTEGLPSSSAREAALSALLELDSLNPDQLQSLNAVALQLASQSARARLQKRIEERRRPGE